MTHENFAEVGRVHSLHLVGDSISLHYHEGLGRRLTGHVAYSRKVGEHGNLDKPEGANGGDSAMVLSYLRDCRTLGLSWHALVVNCGLHDIRTELESHQRQVSEVDYRQNLLDIVAEARALAKQTIWIRTTPIIEAVHNVASVRFCRFERDQQRYNAIADEVMNAARVPLVDLDGFTRSLGGPELFCDHVHFTEPVRELQADFIARSLLALLAE